MDNSIEKSGMQKWLAAERWFAAAFGALFLAVFFGNKLIAAGHGLAGIGVIAALVQRDFRWKWNRFSRSTWCLLTFGVFALLSIVANLDAVESFGAHARKLRYELLVFVLLAIPAATRLLSQSIRPARHFARLSWLGGAFSYDALWTGVFFLWRPTLLSD